MMNENGFFASLSQLVANIIYFAERPAECGLEASTLMNPICCVLIAVAKAARDSRFHTETKTRQYASIRAFCLLPSAFCYKSLRDRTEFLSQNVRWIELFPYNDNDYYSYWLESESVDSKHDRTQQTTRNQEFSGRGSGNSR